MEAVAFGKPECTAAFRSVGRAKLVADLLTARLSLENCGLSVRSILLEETVNFVVSSKAPVDWFNPFESFERAASAGSSESQESTNAPEE